MEKLKVITVKQPYATLLVMGIKLCEIRTWKPTELGRLLIHSGAEPYYGKGYIPELENEWEFMNIVNKFVKEKNTDHPFLRYNGDNLELKENVKGEIVSDFDKLMCMLSECERSEGGMFGNSRIVGYVDISRVEKHGSMYHWVVDDYRIFQKPVKEIAGKQGIWYYDIDIECQEVFRW